MMIFCDYCRTEKENDRPYKTNFCDDCVKEKEIGSPQSIEKVFLKGYGHESKARIAEMERRVILPYDKPGGGYYVGRRGENGKVQERHPSYV